MEIYQQKGECEIEKGLVLQDPKFKIRYRTGVNTNTADIEIIAWEAKYQHSRIILPSHDFGTPDWFDSDVVDAILALPQFKGSEIIKQ